MDAFFHHEQDGCVSALLGLSDSHRPESFHCLQQFGYNAVRHFGVSGLRPSELVGIYELQQPKHNDAAGYQLEPICLCEHLVDSSTSHHTLHFHNH